jgi:PKD repeat protein
LTGSATTPIPGDTFTLAWSVTKNGNAYASSTGANLSFTPNDAGTYVVSLSATDDDGGVGSTNATINVTNVAPTANPGGTYTGTPGTAISFTGTATDPSPIDTFTYAWNFGDGSTSTLQNPTHTYATAGTYTVTLTATDSHGASSATASTTATVVSSSGPPVANAGASQSANEGTAVQFGGSVAGGTAPFTYSWSFGDGTSASGSLTPSHTYVSAGNFTVVLSVRDALNRVSTSTTSAAIGRVNPVANINGPYSGTAGSAIAFSATSTSAGATFSWTFGDGTTATGSSPSHTFSSPGTYVVGLAVTDTLGNTTNATTVATVSPTSVSNVTIDSTWLSNHASVGTGGTMYLLDQANTTYTLATDVTTSGTAFVVGAANVTLNLNGHTVTYDNAAPITVTNAGFEQGSGSSVPGWNLSGAPTATIAPNNVYLFGNQVLQLTNFHTTQQIVSNPISIPVANRTYAATITVAHSSTTPTATLSVIDTVTGQVLGTATAGSVDRGIAPVVRFTPTTTDSVKLQLTVTPNAGATDTVDIDGASVSFADDYGILVSELWSGQMPGYANMSSLAQQEYIRAVNFTVQNGTINQGQAQSYAGCPFFAEYMNGLSINNVQTHAYGIDTDTLDAYSATGSLVVRNSTINESISNITDRMHLGESLALDHTGGAIFIDSNQILGSPHTAIGLTYNNPQYRAVVTNNTISQNAIVANAYAIGIAAAQNFEVAHNTITPTDGRGIDVDGWSSTAVINGLIHDNYVSVQETLNREFYSIIGTEARALRLRNDVDSEGAQQNISIYNNTFIATTGPGYAQGAYGVRIDYVNPNGEMNNSHISLFNNLIKAITTTTDTSFYASALDVDEMAAGIAMGISNNILESNDVSLQICGNDADGTTGVSGVDLISNTLRKSSSGAIVTYTGVQAGYWTNPISAVRLIDMRLDNGATFNFVWSGQGTKNITVASLLDVTAMGASGAFLSGATVTVTNGTGGQVYSGTTRADGQASNIIVPTTVYAQLTTDPSQVTVTPQGPFTIRCTLGTLSTTSQGVSISGDLGIILTLPGA